MFIPSIYLASIYGNPRIAAGLGAGWCVGRLVYGELYAREAEKREYGMAVTMLSQVGLFVTMAPGLFRALRSYLKF